MGDDAAQIWRAITNSLPADWFSAGTLPLLEALCGSTSAYRRITDLARRGDELPIMTQSVNCEIFGLDRNGLVSPSYPSLETIRNQTLPRAITD